MDLTDAGLRERARQIAHGVVSPTNLAAELIALRDAARAEQREVIKDLMNACNELMTEFVSKQRAAKWDVINDSIAALSALARHDPRRSAP